MNKGKNKNLIKYRDKWTKDGINNKLNILIQEGVIKSLIENRENFKSII